MRDRLIVMLAFEGSNLIDIAGPLQAFETAGRIRGDQTPYRLVTASERGGLVRTAPGVVIATEALHTLDTERIDTLIVPGGGVADGCLTLVGLVAWLADNGSRVSRLCAICTGAFLLADAGLIDGRRVTTHWSRCGELHERRPALLVEPDRIFVNDGPVWTSGGVTAGIDLTLALIQADLGYQTALATARQLVMFINRPGGQSQFSAPMALQRATSTSFASLHKWIAEHLHEDLRVERLAEKAGKSARTFARIYAAEVGQTPAHAVELMRLEAACRALEETSLPSKTIAVDVGLGSEQNLRRVMQRQFGIGPSDYRARFGRRVGPGAGR